MVPVYYMNLLYGIFISIIFVGTFTACNSNSKSLRPGAQSQYESTSTSIGVQAPTANVPVQGVIAFTAYDDIYTMDVNGSNPRRVTKTPYGAFQPNWSPDGNHIVYATNDGIFVTDPGGTELIQLAKYSNEVGYAHEPRWSPDGKRIVFDRACKLFVINSDGSGEKQLTYENRPSNMCEWMPDWSPEGNRIVFAGITLKNGRGINMDLYIVNVDGNGLRQVTKNFFTEATPTVMPNGTYSSTFTSEQNPTWSPSGELIAFSMDMAPEDSNSHIYIFRADGNEEPRRLIQQSSFIAEYAPAWSADGQWLVFSADDNDNTRGLWIVRADGTVLTRLNNVSDYDDDPSWYPVR